MTSRRRYPTAMLEEVAQVIRDQHGLQPHARAVAQHLDCSVSHARYVIQAIRYAGHDLPTDSSKWRYMPAELFCACGHVCSLDEGIPGLQRHTMSTHGRLPTRDERTPRTVLVAA